MALEQEKRVSEEIFALFELAREVRDYRAEQFLQWFVKEQVEEVALMSDLLNVVERAKDNLLLAEDYLARERSAKRAPIPRCPPPPAEPSSPDGPAACGRHDALTLAWRASGGARVCPSACR